MKKKKSIKKAEFQFKNPYFINIFHDKEGLGQSYSFSNELEVKKQIANSSDFIYLFTIKFDDKEALIVDFTSKNFVKKLPAKVNKKPKTAAIAKSKVNKKVVKASLKLVKKSKVKSKK